MMGIKERRFLPLANPSLEGLVPPDHFYRHLERSLDLRFVRDLVRDRYAPGGRPSVDPVVFFKTHPRHCPFRTHRPHGRDDPGR
jgi:hypothetical protein